MSHYQSHLTAITDWHQFIEDCAIEYGIPVETMYKIAMDILVMRQRVETLQ